MIVEWHHPVAEEICDESKQLIEGEEEEEEEEDGSRRSVVLPAVRHLGAQRSGTG